MRAISNAFFSQAEFVQQGHWLAGPLELVFFDPEKGSSSYDQKVLLAANWNRSYEGGYLRPGDAVEKVPDIVPGFDRIGTPNIFLVPQEKGVSALDVMLASLVPLRILGRHGIRKRQSTNLWLMYWGQPDHVADFGARCRAAFEEFVWPMLLPGSRNQQRFFSPDSPVRLLAGDSRMWMNRIYRTALEIWETEFESTKHEEPGWMDLDDIRTSFFSDHPTLDPETVVVQRPRMGGDLWDPKNELECRRVVYQAISTSNGGGSLEEIVALARRHRAHEDFSETYSWVKEDFEKSFYSKRARLKVSLVETVDDFPAWNANEPEGYGNILFRDIIAALDLSERHLVLALRHGKTVSEIAREFGYASHAPVCRKIARLKAKVRRLLQ